MSAGEDGIGPPGERCFTLDIAASRHAVVKMTVLSALGAALVFSVGKAGAFASCRMSIRLAFVCRFDGKAEDATTFNTAIFVNSKAVDIMRFGDSGLGPKGRNRHLVVRLAGRWPSSAVRLADRQARRFVAPCAHGTGGNTAGQQMLLDQPSFLRAAQ